MSFKKTFSVLCAGAVLILSMSTICMADDYKLTLKLSHVFSPAEQLSKSMDAVAESIYEKNRRCNQHPDFSAGTAARIQGRRGAGCSRS